MNGFTLGQAARMLVAWDMYRSSGEGEFSWFRTVEVLSPASIGLQSGFPQASLCNAVGAAAAVLQRPRRCADGLPLPFLNIPLVLLFGLKLHPTSVT